MIVDTSALIEVVFKGPKREAVRNALNSARRPRTVSAVSWVEAHIVIRRKFGEEVASRTAEDLDALMRGYTMQIQPVSVVQAQIAIEAYKRFGKGGGAGLLNFGDCFPYALAKARKDELLFVGEDFSRTDVKVVKL